MSRPSSIALMPLVSILSIFYFTYHLINGERGIKAYLKLNQKIIEANKDLEFLEKKKKKSEQLLNLLHPQSIDPEMAEERIRTMLGYGSPDEQVIFLDVPIGPQNKRPNVVVLTDK